jgi:hypothetical protein
MEHPTGGSRLIKQSSFDKLMTMCKSPVKEDDEGPRLAAAAATLQQWARARAQQAKLRALLTTLGPPATTILTTLRRFQPPTPTFPACRALLGDAAFSAALATLLAAMPLDPSLKGKNPLARQPRTFASALLVAYHPSEVLLDEADREDHSLEVPLLCCLLCAYGSIANSLRCGLLPVRPGGATGPRRYWSPDPHASWPSSLDWPRHPLGLWAWGAARCGPRSWVGATLSALSSKLSRRGR